MSQNFGYLHIKELANLVNFEIVTSAEVPGWEWSVSEPMIKWLKIKADEKQNYFSVVKMPNNMSRENVYLPRD